MKKKKKRKNNKKKAVDTHFAIRCLERIGHIPNKNQLVQDIQNGRLEFYDRCSNRVTRWLWKDEVTNEEYIIPYDKERKQVITILYKLDGENTDEYKTNRE